MSGMGIKDPLFFIGCVENNIDRRLEGRVQVRVFNVHGKNTEIPTEDLPWATLIIGSYDTNFVVPPVNSWVFGFFIDGRDAQQPMILGIIPTQMTKAVNPTLDGYGSIPLEYPELLSMGSRPEDFGQPMNSNLARGENLENTYNLALETNRVKGIKNPASPDETWEEPSSAYAAEYPFNRVIQTAGGHSIELDDTPGAERIMIWHASGSYVQVNSAGTTTHKSMNDKYEINEVNQHVYVGGKSLVVIEGDSNILVKGSKYEEIHGDYKQVIHGNHEITVAGQMNLNASDEIQARAAKITIEANVEDVSLKSSKSLVFSSGQSITMGSGMNINLSAADIYSVKSTDVIIDGSGVLNLKGESAVKIGSGSKTSISGSIVAIDDYVYLSSGMADSPDSAEGVPVAKSVTSTQPTEKYVYTASTKNGSSSGSSSGYSPDATSDYSATNASYGSDTGSSTYTGDGNFTSTCGTSLLEEIKKEEKFSANAYWDEKQYSIGYGLRTDNPNEVITESEAERRLKLRLAADRNDVQNYGLSKGYKWNDCQVDALTSFVYNLGIGTLPKVTDNGKRTDSQIAEAMLQYNGVIDSNGNKKILSGLVDRRNRESNWFKDGIRSGETQTASGTVI